MVLQFVLHAKLYGPTGTSLFFYSGEKRGEGRKKEGKTRTFENVVQRGSFKEGNVEAG